MMLFALSDHGSSFWHFVPFLLAAALLLHAKTRRKVKALVLLLAALVRRCAWSLAQSARQKLRSRALRAKAKKESDLNANIDRVENVRLLLPKTNDEKPKQGSPRAGAKKIVSIEEARRRSTLNALELANDDTSLMPELLDSSHLLNDSSVLSLCKNLPARCVGCPWKLLYSTFEHGMSLRTLYRKMSRVAEDSPTAIIVQDSEGHIFGAVSSCPPQISEHFKGTGEGFLFTLEPSLQIFSWTGENMFFMKGDTDSLTIGGGDGLSGLWLDGDLCHGSSHTCLTFNNAVLSSSEDFFIQGVEVWGFCDT